VTLRDRSHAGHFAIADQVLDRDLLDRCVGIDVVLIQQIDPVGLEPLERCIGDLADVRRSAVQPRLLPTFKPESELRRDDDLTG
jgi:hypothetical protein